MTKSGKHCGKKRNCLFFHYVFKKLSAAEASESIYMRERVKDDKQNSHIRSVGAAIFLYVSTYKKIRNVSVISIGTCVLHSVLSKAQKDGEKSHG